jgi:hypothetical protein
VKATGTIAPAPVADVNGGTDWERTVVAVAVVVQAEGLVLQ